MPAKKDIKDLSPAALSLPLRSPGKGKSYQMAKVLVTRGGKKGSAVSHSIVGFFDQKVNADYSTNTIVAADTVYELTGKLHCTVDIGDGAIQIENDTLGISGIGLTFDEAEKAFAEEFDYIYKRYHELPDKKLTKDVLSIKKALKGYVKKSSADHAGIGC